MTSFCHVMRSGRPGDSPAYGGPHVVEAPFECAEHGGHRPTNCSQCGAEVKLPALLPDGIYITSYYEEYLRRLYPNLAGSQSNDGNRSVLGVHVVDGFWDLAGSHEEIR